MARNAEKAQSTLHRWAASQAQTLGLIDITKTRRPRAVQTVDQLPLAERWRGQVVTEIGRKHSKIQDQSLSDYQIRDLNDQLNKLFGEKRAWERRIRELGGPNYARGAADALGRELKGYRYFGRALELPGVKEAFEAREAKDREEREGAKGGATSNDMRGKIVDAAYYGWNNDEADGSLLKYEAGVEQLARERMLREADKEAADPDWQSLPGDAGDGVRWELPTQEEVQEELLARRRQALLDKLGT